MLTLFYQALVPDDAGIIRSQVFPGLWLDLNALLNNQMARVLEIWHQGIAAPEHPVFVENLVNHTGIRNSE